MLCACFPHLSEEHEADADACYHALFGALPLDAWRVGGTILYRVFNGKQLNFAARKTHCTVAFHGKDAIAFYRDIGGECPVGEVTIKVPHGAAFEAEPIRDAIEWYFYN